MTTDAGPDGPPAEPPVQRVQMNVRVPATLREQIDARREPLGLSRDLWVERALTWALAQPPARRKHPTSLKGSVVAETVRGRTVDPKRARP